MSLLDEHKIVCPNCGETITIARIRIFFEKTDQKVFTNNKSLNTIFYEM